MKVVSTTLYIIWILFCFIEIAAGRADGKEYRLLNLEYQDVAYQKFKGQRDSYVPEYDNRMDYRVSTSFRVGMLNNLIYWDNKVHMEALDTGVPKTVGWYWVLGLRVTDQIDIFQEHHSRHAMEEAGTTRDGRSTFPVEDSYGIKIKLIDNPAKNTISGWFK